MQYLCSSLGSKLILALLWSIEYTIVICHIVLYSINTGIGTVQYQMVVLILTSLLLGILSGSSIAL